jgi:hypothetical protein
MVIELPMGTILGKYSSGVGKALWLTVDRLAKMTGMYANQRGMSNGGLIQKDQPLTQSRFGFQLS